MGTFLLISWSIRKIFCDVLRVTNDLCVKAIPTAKLTENFCGINFFSLVMYSFLEQNKYEDISFGP